MNIDDYDSLMYAAGQNTLTVAPLEKTEKEKKRKTNRDFLQALRTVLKFLQEHGNDVFLHSGIIGTFGNPVLDRHWRPGDENKIELADVRYIPDFQDDLDMFERESNIITGERRFVKTGQTLQEYDSANSMFGHQEKIRMKKADEERSAMILDDKGEGSEEGSAKDSTSTSKSSVVKNSASVVNPSSADEPSASLDDPYETSFTGIFGVGLIAINRATSRLSTGVEIVDQVKHTYVKEQNINSGDSSELSKCSALSLQWLRVMRQSGFFV